jgi:hypothetical protein
LNNDKKNLKNFERKLNSDFWNLESEEEKKKKVKEFKHKINEQDHEENK